MSAVCGKERLDLLGPCGQKERCLLSSWTKSSRTSSSLELGAEGRTSEVANEEEDLTLGNKHMLLSQGLPPARPGWSLHP